MTRDKRNHQEYCRDRLIGCIPKQLLVTRPAIELREKLEAAKALPSNAPDVTFTMSSRTYTDDMWLQEQGVDPAQPQNQALRTHFTPMDDFEHKWINSQPNTEAIAAIIPTLKAVFEFLQNLPTPPPSDAVLEMAWSKLGQCCETISLGLTEPAADEFKIVRTILLACSHHPSPKPDEKDDRLYDSPFWSPQPRNEAARGLLRLGLRIKDPEILSAIDDLAKDKVPSVRFLTAHELFRISQIDSEFYWKTLSARAEVETSPGVQLGICNSLRCTIANNEKAGTEVLALLVKNIELTNDRSQLLESLLSLLVWLILEKKSSWATKIVLGIIDNPLKYPAAIKNLTFQALSAMTPAELEADSVTFDSAGKWLSQFAEAAIKALTELRKKPDSEWNEDTRTAFRDIYGVLDEIVMRFYFAAGVKEHEKSTITPAMRCFFFKKIHPFLELIVAFALDSKHGVLLASTAHHLMELLHACIHCNPKLVLSMARKVAVASVPFNYNIDSLAVAEVVRLVETVLADYRQEVQDGESLEDVLTLLDVFAQAGWPQAQQLVWRLDEVFR